LSAAAATPEIPHANAEPGILADLLDLTKARLNLLVLITTFVGFWMGSAGPIHWLRLIQAMLATALCAASAAAFNQLWEVKVDALMTRTANRPVTAGRMKKSAAFWIAVALGAAGTAWLALAANFLSAALAASTIVIYVLIYTPMKRRTALCTLVGAVSGAIPPVVGWAAANPHLTLGAWVLFAILFTWQMPHFLAIAWMHREQYRGAGLVMLKGDDQTGFATAATSFVFTMLLTAATLVPFNAGSAGGTYLGGALLINSLFFLAALHFWADRSRPVARRLFFASIIYLPLILGLMVFTKES
jgi:protoheme IX farnesyltransferase